MFWSILVFTFLVCFAWSRERLFWVDEVLEYYSDAKPGFQAVIDGQLRYPFSLEPPGFHLLLHAMQSIFSKHAEFASRLPSIFGLLVTETCVFFTALRLLGNPAAALGAMVCPLFLTTIDYGPEARVYSLLTALFALAVLSYQSAVHREQSGEGRVLPLIGLFGSLGVAILIHYYAILLPLPFVAGEMIRFVQRRRVDWPLLFAVAGAFSLFALNLPFMKPLHQIQAHYYDTGETRWRMIAFTYMWFIGHFGIYLFSLVPYPKVMVRVALAFTMIFVFVLVYATLRWFGKRRWLGDPRAAVVAVLLAGFLLPVTNLLVARYFTHAYVLRYSLPACVSLSVLPWIAWRKWSRYFPAIGVLLFCFSMIYAMRHISKDREIRQNRLPTLALSEELRAAIEGQPDHHLYFQDGARFLTTYYYASPAVKETMRGVRSSNRELKWLHHDTVDTFGRNMSLTTRLPWVRYEDLQMEPGPHLFVIYNDPIEEWIGNEIDSGTISAQRCGSAFQGTLYRLTFHPAHPEPSISR